ncbi:MAG: tetratricopeptide repeat protein [Bacteroidota bacterium]
MKQKLTAVILTCLVSLPLFSQPQQEEATAESMFYDAAFWYVEEQDFQEAAYLYRQVLKLDPENANAKYLLGMCYLNIKGMEEEAIPLFLEATKGINLKYKEAKFEMKQSPHHTWYYLADAYRKTNQLDKAMEALESFKDLIDFEKHYHIRLTEEFTEEVERAKTIWDNELKLQALYFDRPVNTTEDDYSAVISADRKMMVWVTSKAFYEAMYMSIYEEGEWSTPFEIGPQIVSDGNLFPTGLSNDGSTMLLVYRPEEGNSDIWYSQFDGSSWSPAQPVHGAINTTDNEEHASFSPDGNRIYLTTDRKGGKGGLDIWYSDRQEDGQWGEPFNMGGTINTAEDETSGYIAPDGGRFIFASKGHFNMGGYDIFRSEKEIDGRWSETSNMGYPVNTTGDDTYFVPLSNGMSGLYSRFTTVGIGMTDLWYMEIGGEEGFVSGGMVLAIDTRQKISRRPFAIIMVDEASGEEIEVLYDAETDTFKAYSDQNRTFKVVSYKEK